MRRPWFKLWHVLTIMALLMAYVMAQAWAYRAISDPDDQCNDTDSPLVARVLVCQIGGR